MSDQEIPATQPLQDPESWKDQLRACQLRLEALEQVVAQHDLLLHGMERDHLRRQLRMKVQPR